MKRLKLRMADAFPADDPIARWVMNLSVALGDLRIASKYATREEQPDHERIYFVRIFSSHLREISKLLVLNYREREDVRQFVATLPQEGQEARDEVERKLHSTHALRPDAVMWRDLKRIRDDTFHYASDSDSQERLHGAMHVVADIEGIYVEDDEGDLRAEYADLVTANRMHPFDEDESLPMTREMQDAIINLVGPVATFIAHAEATYLLSRLPEGVVTRVDD